MIKKLTYTKKEATNTLGHASRREREWNHFKKYLKFQKNSETNRRILK